MLHPSALAALDLTGPIITPGAPDYDGARTIVYGGFDRRPAAIVRAASADDVAKVVNFARQHGVELAVRSGGHSNAGHCTTEGGIVLDVSRMKGLELDPANSTAWVEPGTTAEELTKAIEPNGLIIGFGDAGTVGVSGIMLGGGVGYLARKYGLSIDSLLAVDIVTADGLRLTADADHHPDLFWAVRGGGGNFGVLTRLKVQLRPLPAFTGGLMVLPATAEVVAGFIAGASAASDDLSTIANVMPAPPMPFLPENMVGKLIIFAMMAYAGEPAAAAAALAPFRALATPLADFVQPMPYSGMYPPDEGDYHPLAIGRTLFVDDIDLEVARTIIATLEASDAAMRVAQLRVLGGATARIPADATAYAHRQRAIMINVATFYEGAHDYAKRHKWVTDFAAALAGDSTGAYVNFLADEGPERVRDAYPGLTWDRLRRIKKRYDPHNLFRLNQNIPPAE